jgi:hypothetical protein
MTTARFSPSLLSYMISLGLLGLAGCESEIELAEEPSAEDPGELDADEPNADEFRSLPFEGCKVKRQITRDISEQGCNDVQQWAGEQLFEDNAPPVLRKYCVYTWQGSGEPSSAQIATLANTVDAIAPDCEVVFGQSTDPLSTHLGPLLTTMFHEAINWVSPADLALDENDRSPVRVAVVDTVPNSGNFLPRSRHGKLVAKVIEDIACPDPNATECAVTVDHYLALPRHGDDLVDWANGGHYGSKVELARAIYAAAKSGQAGEKLIINLSLGWEPTLGGDDPSTELGVAIVKGALDFASCKKALIIASAGNDGGLCEPGALLPGKWESLLRPTPSRCFDDFGITVTGQPGSTYLPLVYSVGGLNTDRTDLMPGSRVQGLPRFLAPASHAMVDSSNPTSAVTGTSVASAAVTGAAALAWSYNPDLTLAQVMDTLYAKGDAVGAMSHYGPPGHTSVPMRALDICSAMQQICSGVTGCSMPLLASWSCNDAATVTLDDIANELALIPKGPEIPLSFTPGADCVDCEGNLDDAYSADPSEANACPDYDPVLTFTEPQPTQPPCPACTVTKKDGFSEGVFTASLDSAYVNMTVANVTVDVYDGTRTTYYRLGPITLDTTTTQQFVLSPMYNEPVRANVTIQFNEQITPQTNALIVLP